MNGRIEDRLLGTLQLDAVNGDSDERAVVIDQIREAMVELNRLRGRVADLEGMDRGFATCDTQDDYTPTIRRLHPAEMPNGGGQRLVLAERLVHNRQSKWALVYLVHALLHERDEAQAAAGKLETLLDGRAGKLLKKGKPFVVVACDEPYYHTVYRLIREREKAVGRWTKEDEAIYEAALAGKGK